MERPENIKKGLACFAQDRSYMLPCSDCDYHGQGKPHCRKAVHEDALALIRQLEKDVFMRKMALLGMQDLIAKQERVRSNLQEEIWQLKQQVPKWISVEEQPEPPEDDVYYCYGYWIRSGRKQAETAEYLCGEWKIENNFVLTHWMPLPEPPTEGV